MFKRKGRKPPIFIEHTIGDQTVKIPIRAFMFSAPTVRREDLDDEYYALLKASGLIRMGDRCYERPGTEYN